ncbi:helix-turn-helix domain-containing protein [Achromobacter xylosoxidans]
MTVPTKFATKLRTLRERRGISQADLARMTGIAPAQLSRYEVGRSIPRSEVIARLADALDVEYAELSAIDDLVLPVVVTADMMEALKLEAAQAGCSVEEAAGNRLLSSFFPRAEDEFKREQLEYLQSVVNAFEATSEDFEQELGERLGRYLATFMKKHEPVLVRPIIGAETALTKHLAAVVEGINKPRTPKIPGVNAPKEGIGAAPKPAKPKREKPTVTKKRVFVHDDDASKEKDE